MEILSLHEKMDDLRVEKWEHLLEIQQKQIEMLTTMFKKHLEEDHDQQAGSLMVSLAACNHFAGSSHMLLQPEHHHFPTSSSSWPMTLATAIHKYRTLSSRIPTPEHGPPRDGKGCASPMRIRHRPSAHRLAMAC